MAEPTKAGANQALEQTRDSVLRYGEPVGRELLNLIVRRKMGTFPKWEASDRNRHDSRADLARSCNA